VPALPRVRRSLPVHEACDVPAPLRERGPCHGPRHGHGRRRKPRPPSPHERPRGGARKGRGRVFRQGCRKSRPPDPARVRGFRWGWPEKPARGVVAGVRFRGSGAGGAQGFGDVSAGVAAAAVPRLVARSIWAWSTFVRELTFCDPFSAELAASDLEHLPGTFPTSSPSSTNARTARGARLAMRASRSKRAKDGRLGWARLLREPAPRALSVRGTGRWSALTRLWHIRPGPALKRRAASTQTSSPRPPPPWPGPLPTEAKLPRGPCQGEGGAGGIRTTSR
jgi:hypothetical protein